jgi:hypothetical protein
VLGADRLIVGEAKRREIGGETFLFVIVDLVNDKDYRLARFAYEARKFLIKRREPVSGVDNEKKNIAIVDRAFDSAANLRRQFGFTGSCDAAGVRENEGPHAAHANRRDPIAGYSRSIVHDGNPATDQSIE